jgi:gentisate 1,2-dioxygenase
MTTLPTRDRNLPDAYSDTLEKLSLAPLWAALHVHRNHAAAAPACLFHLTDEPALAALGLWREELAPPRA